jgi:hypothetical protein
MNKRQILILWGVVAILAGAATTLRFSKQEAPSVSTTRAAGQTLFESFPATDVATIELSGASGSIGITKKDGIWTVDPRDGYPADASKVNEFLRSLSELKVTRAMQAGPTFAPRFGMDEASTDAEKRGLTAAFKDSTGKEIAKVSLGKDIETEREGGFMGGPMAVGRYVRNHADSSAFYAVGETFSSLATDAAGWLDDSFFALEKIRSISLSAKGSDDIAWKLVRDNEGADFTVEGLAAEETTDTTAVSPLKSLFSYARFEDVVPAALVESRSDEPSRRKATVTTFDDFTYSFVITPAKDGDDKLLLTVDVTAEIPTEREKSADEKPEDGKTRDDAFNERVKALTEKLEKEKKLAGRTFEVTKFSVESLLKEREQIVKKVESPAADQASAENKQPVEAVTPPIAVPPAPPKASKPAAKKTKSKGKSQ